MRLKRARRVRIHFVDQEPSLEGFLVSRRRREYAVALPRVLLAEGAEPVVLDEAQLAVVPRERVFFFEVLSGH